MPAVDSRGYPVKGSCVLEDVGLVAVFAGLVSPQPGKLTYHTPCSPAFALTCPVQLSSRHCGDLSWRCIVTCSIIKHAL